MFWWLFKRCKHFGKCDWRRLKCFKRFRSYSWRQVKRYTHFWKCRWGRVKCLKCFRNCSWRQGKPSAIRIPENVTNDNSKVCCLADWHQRAFAPGSSFRRFRCRRFRCLRLGLLPLACRLAAAIMFFSTAIVISISWNVTGDRLNASSVSKNLTDDKSRVIRISRNVTHEAFNVLSVSEIEIHGKSTVIRISRNATDGKFNVLSVSLISTDFELSVIRTSNTATCD